MAKTRVAAPLHEVIEEIVADAFDEDVTRLSVSEPPVWFHDVGFDAVSKLYVAHQLRNLYRNISGVAGISDLLRVDAAHAYDARMSPGTVYQPLRETTKENLYAAQASLIESLQGGIESLATMLGSESIA